jgi:methionine sulfoxide reductase heme-binding subunit
MSVQYQAIGWNRQKRNYDLVVAGVTLLYLVIFISAGAVLQPNATAETLVIRALGTCSLLLLHVILCIGPLCRLQPGFLPLLYNRRHLGVTMFLLALGHSLFGLVQFHALGDVSPMVSLFTSNTRYRSLPDFPFQMLGFFALIILLLMAAISHDFWLRNLGAPVWKRLHMLVYAAYALLIGHVLLGALQSETSPILVATLAAGMTTVIALHLAAASRTRQIERRHREAKADGFIEVCAVNRIQENRARIVSLSGERVAVFRYDGKISAVSNVCQHQNGPLGEGRIVDGCITCPWHGYQYLPESGASPAPFTERIPTFQTKVIDGKVLVHPCPHPPGTRLEPSFIEELTGATRA